VNADSAQLESEVWSTVAFLVLTLIASVSFGCLGSQHIRRKTYSRTAGTRMF
jgi:hypothetical protein